MAITRKPKGTGEASIVDIDALINKGGSTPKRDVIDKEGAVAVVLRIPAGILERIDAAVKARPIRTPRHTWLLEALHEKLQRDLTD